MTACIGNDPYCPCADGDACHYRDYPGSPAWPLRMIPQVRVPHADYMARLHWRLRARLPMWVVYRPVTREYPGRWVARMHVTLPETRPTRFVMTHDSLDELRSLLPPDLTWMERNPQDVPEIEEVWL